MSQTTMTRSRDEAALASACPPPPGKRGPANNEVIWVYAVTAGLDRHQLAGLTGVGGEQVRTLTEDGLAAVIGSVDASIFGEESLTSLLADMKSIERVGRAHHNVIERVAADGPILPLRLATIYPDDATVRTLLARRHDELAGMLMSLEGTQEWGVKVYLGPRGAMRGGAAAAPRPRSQEDRDSDDQVWDALEAQAREIDEALSRVAVAARRQPSPDPQFAGADGWVMLNGSYLVSTERAAEFTKVAEELAAEHTGIRADVTGPWPPYSFAERLEATA